MILVTGGAGFIGSNLQAALAKRGESCVVCDWLGSEGKWRNLARHPPSRLVRPEALDAYLVGPPGRRRLGAAGSGRSARDDVSERIEEILAAEVEP